MIKNARFFLGAPKISLKNRKSQNYVILDHLKIIYNVQENRRGGGGFFSDGKFEIAAFDIFFTIKLNQEP